jgi:hypothetical protein
MNAAKAGTFAELRKRTDPIALPAVMPTGDFSGTRDQRSVKPDSRRSLSPPPGPSYS